MNSLLNEMTSLIARQWIAGTTTNDAMNAALETSSTGKLPILNYLGEAYTKKQSVEHAIEVYDRLIDHINSSDIHASISVKPSQLGILISKKLFLSSYERVIEKAEENNLEVWLDMEEYEFIDETIKAYMHMLKEHKNIGICLQAKLKRTEKDAMHIARAHGAIRLVKGAYNEPENRAFKSDAQVSRAYISILEKINGKARSVIIATHDEKLIRKAMKLKRKAKTEMSFAMLRGVRGNLADELIGKHQKVHVYIPFGEEWLAYSIRRLKELSHALLIIRSVFQQ